MTQLPALPVFRSGSRVHDCYCDGLLTSTGGELVFLSLYGTYNSVRAVWARMIEGGTLELEGNKVSLEKNRFSRIRSNLVDGLLHIVFVAEAATEQPSYATHFYQIGPECAKLFFNRLDRYSSVPFPRDMVPLLWEKGLEAKLITPLSGFGMEGYLISVWDDKWSKIVMAQLALENKE